MFKATTKQDLLIEFFILAVIFSVFNYFGKFKVYATDPSKRVFMSVGAGLAVAMVLTIIKPPIKAWLRARREAKRSEI